MITNNFKTFKAAQALSELPTKEFNKLLGVSYSTRYAWRERTRILPVYKILGTLITKNKELVQKAVYQPQIKTLGEVSEYKQDLGTNLFFDMLMIKEHVYYSWFRRNSIRQCYLTLINCMVYDFNLVQNVVLNIEEVEDEYEFHSDEMIEYSRMGKELVEFLSEEEENNTERDETVKNSNQNVLETMTEC